MGSYKKFSHKSSMFVNTVGLICSLTQKPNGYTWLVSNLVPWFKNCVMYIVLFSYFLEELLLDIFFIYLSH